MMLMIVIYDDDYDDRYDDDRGYDVVVVIYASIIVSS